MSLSQIDTSPFQVNLPLETLNLINQPVLYKSVETESETNYSKSPTNFFNKLLSSNQTGSGKTKKKVKEIDMYKKDALEKIAKKHDISLKAKDGKIKTKEQLFKSLKRKDLLKKKLKGGSNDEFKEEIIDVFLTDKSLILEMEDKFIFSKIVFSIPKKDLINNNKPNDLDVKKLMNLIKNKNLEMYENVKNNISYEKNN